MNNILLHLDPSNAEHTAFVDALLLELVEMSTSDTLLNPFIYINQIEHRVKVGPHPVETEKYENCKCLLSFIEHRIECKFIWANRCVRGVPSFCHRDSLHMKLRTVTLRSFLM